MLAKFTRYTVCFCALDPPEKFDSKMNNNSFFLLLNVNGIPYKVCKKLEGETIVFKSILDNISIVIMLMCPECDITAKDFNLGSYDLWSKEIQLSWKEKPALKKLIGKISPALQMLLESLKDMLALQLCSDTCRCLAKVIFIPYSSLPLPSSHWTGCHS